MARKIRVPIGDGKTHASVMGNDDTSKIELVMGTGYRFASKGDLRRYLLGKLQLPLVVQEILDAVDKKKTAKLSHIAKGATAGDVLIQPPVEAEAA